MEYLLWPMLLAVMLIGAVWYVYLRRNNLAARLDKTGKLLVNFSSRKNIFKAVLASLGIITLCIALMHPRWGRINESVEQQGRDLLIALDISRSMLTQDVKPDRLTCAKRVINELMSALETDRVGLMVFCEQARVYCPLTKDAELVRMFLESIDASTLSNGTTRLDQPVMCAIEQCKRFADRKNHVLVLVSDGEDFSKNLDTVKQRACDLGLTILVVGVGTMQGAPIPLYNEQNQRIGYLKDMRDRVIISQLNKVALQTLADQSGGSAFFVENETIRIHELVARIKQFERERQGQAMVSSLREQYHWFLLVSFICFLCEWLL